MDELMIRIDNVSKQYRLGAIGGGTLQRDLQSWWALKRGKEDPNSKIGAKQYGKNEKFLALDGVSFEVKKGERVGIIGHNGAGKSTLLKLLSRVTAPTTGEINLNGRVASMLEVGTGFHGELTGRENIYMNGAILGMSKKEIDAKMEDIIEFSECRQFIDTPVKRYSSGMYVKLAFSVAAHLDSEIMIMDEVLAVGDMAFQKKCLEKMADVSKTDGRTILYVSHNMNTIRQLCDRVIVLDHGKVVFDGDVEEGIGYYFSQIETSGRVICFLPEHKISKNTSANFVFNSLSITPLKEKAIYYIGDTFDFSLYYQVKQKINRLCIAIVFYYQDQSPVTMMVSDELCFEETSSGRLNLSADISNFAPGKYTMDICSYEVGEMGKMQFHDIVRRNVVNLEVISKEIYNQGREWNHSLWGHFISPKLKVNQLEK